ncbi:SusC/RagA family TonB-linked outer membrane protein [Halosquirtibacter xylanolyticus]|uniref:SusC/RagA family TonB-linked outer membrane protein n=1 Tax=Halosquirtibacter xylanolyticus TaxID=3374599 RepID=UPI0037498170|nr:SusC/RagA family TonB-linked outer membrane protein [Prolixibacteraceae bacterium]
MKKQYSLFLLLLLFCCSWSVSAQETRTIHGVVFDAASGETLPGASVFLDNTVVGVLNEVQSNTVVNYSQGTISNINGVFSLKVPKSAEFVSCSFVGYETKKIAIPSSGKLVIQLKSDVSNIEEIVVTGYQNIKERKLTASVVKLKTDDIIQANVSSIDQMLAGQLAGVQTTVTSGAPGAPAKIRIRGNASLNGSQDPLWVVDGVPLTNTDVPSLDGKDISDLTNSSIAGLNPNDIESITVLKDAAATAIYGARASNGVIVVTTKKGKKGKVNVNINSNISFVQRPKMNDLNLLNASEKVDLELQMAGRTDFSPWGSYNYHGGEVMRILENDKNGQSNELSIYQDKGFDHLSKVKQDQISALRSSGSDWGKEIYRSAVNQNHNLSVSGGSDFATYYVSMGYYDEKGTTVGTGMNRSSITMRTDFNVTNNLNVGLKVFANRRKNSSFLQGTENYTNPNRYSRNVNPYLNIYNKDGSYKYDRDTQTNGNEYLPFNFVEEREGTMYNLTSMSYLAQFDLEWRILKDLTFRSTLGYQYDQSLAEKRADWETFYSRHRNYKSEYTDSDGNKQHFLPEGQIRNNLDRRINQWNVKNILEYNKTFGSKHELDLMIGDEIRHDDLAQRESWVYGFNPVTLTSKPLVYHRESDANGFPTYGEAAAENAYVSYFGTFSYSFDRRYSLFGSIRTDASNIFGKNTNDLFVPLWAMGAAWNIDKEAFYNLDFMNKAKLRLSYGLQGNIDKSTAPTLVGEWNQHNILGGLNENAIVVTGAPNPDLMWEKTTNYDLGIELGFFKNRLQFTADIYSRNSYDLIGTKELAHETGFYTSPVNWAEVSNKGYELSLTAQPIRSKRFSWDVTFNWSHNKDQVEKIHVGDQQVVPSREGLPVNAMFGFKTRGLSETGMPIYDDNGKGVSATEFFKLEALWDYAPLTASTLSSDEIRDRYTYMGTTDPKFTGGIVNSFRYKGFTLYVAANFFLKGMKRETPFYSAGSFDRSRNYSSKVNQIWSPENKDGVYPAIMSSTSDPENPYEYYAYNSGGLGSFEPFKDLDIWFKEVNYIRISNIRLSYNLPKSFTDKLGVGTTSVKVEALNPFVFGTDYSGYFDPETYGSVYSQPIAKSFSVGLNLSF